MDDDLILDLFERRSENAISETRKKYGDMCRRVACNILTGDDGIESVGVSMISRESTHPEYTNIWLPVSYIRPEYIFSLHDDIPDPLDK